MEVDSFSPEPTHWHLQCGFAIHCSPKPDCATPQVGRVMTVSMDEFCEVSPHVTMTKTLAQASPESLITKRNTKEYALFYRLAHRVTIYIVLDLEL